MAADILKLVSLADTHAVDEPHAPTADIGFGFNGDSPVGRVRFWNPRESVIEMPARRESVD
ncbi:MAG: hypothetical protein JWO97_1, partial [Acidobacteria bacterium]|nr:hypothetical protein [Acidobacteriota bacterium]